LLKIKRLLWMNEEIQPSRQQCANVCDKTAFEAAMWASAA